MGGGVGENKPRLSSWLVPYAGGCVGCLRRCGVSNAGVACLSHCFDVLLGLKCGGLNVISEEG